MHRSHALLAVSFFACLVLTGCTSTKPSLGLVYQIEIVQGNFVSGEQVAALRTGMPKAQVKNILGTPLLTDVFHENRWDYVFNIVKGGTTSQSRQLAVFFKDNVLQRWEGDAMPSEVAFVQSLSSGRPLGQLPALEATEQQLSEFAKREPATLQPQSSVQPIPPHNKSYPPLELP
jgi:outer membrane protein assembly factor BamE